jgi:glycosyltransferase involved in cell wall biosynthesis
VFPSLRDNGAGIVFEALGCGAVPLVVDFGGPGDIVHAEVGYKVPLTNESDIVAQMQKILGELAANPEQLEQLRRQGMAYVRDRLTWEAKAQYVTRILQWAIGKGAKPDLPPPKVLAAAVGSTR